MMFEKNLKRRIESRGLVGAFGGCLEGIRGLGKKIGPIKFSVSFQKFPNTLSFYQVNQIMPNLPQKDHQSL
jgi:hypothetical protein